MSFRKRGINLPVDTLEELEKAVVMKKPETLTTFLARFKYWMPAYTLVLVSKIGDAKGWSGNTGTVRVLAVVKNHLFNTPHFLV